MPFAREPLATQGASWSSQLARGCLLRRLQHGEASKFCADWLANSPAALPSSVAVVLQASGPHFCPGGNVQANLREGEDAFTLHPFTGFVAELRLREVASGMIVAALHGLVQGGGVALSQVADLRFADLETTYVLGNLSRGAVPCILLSRALALIFPSTTSAMAFYLEDCMLDAQAALALGLIEALCPSPSSTRAAAMHPAMSAKALQSLNLMRVPLDAGRFAEEARGLQLSLSCGEAFQSSKQTPQPPRPPQPPPLSQQSPQSLSTPQGAPLKRRIRQRQGRQPGRPRQPLPPPASRCPPASESGHGSLSFQSLSASRLRELSVLSQRRPSVSQVGRLAVEDRAIAPAPGRWFV